jgi:hypothetical protein
MMSVVTSSVVTSSVVTVTMISVVTVVVSVVVMTMNAVISVVTVVECDDDECGDSDNPCGGVVKASVMTVTMSAMIVIL